MSKYSIICLRLQFEYRCNSSRIKPSNNDEQQNTEQQKKTKRLFWKKQECRKTNSWIEAATKKLIQKTNPLKTLKIQHKVAKNDLKRNVICKEQGKKNASINRKKSKKLAEEQAPNVRC